MATRSGGARARGLGAEIRKIRDSLDRSLESLVEPVGLSIATLSRIENGQRVCKPDELISILTVLGVTGKERERLVRTARECPEISWLGLSAEQRQQFATLTSYEDDAIRISSVSPLVIPGLLQTVSYARTLMSLGNNDDIELAVSKRMRRQSNLSRPTLEGYVAVLDESTLRRPIGGSAVMVNQLAHLLDIGQSQQVTVLIVPFDAGWYPGLDGPFCLYELTRREPIVYFDSHERGAFLEASETGVFRRALTRAIDYALNSDESAGMIEEYFERWKSERTANTTSVHSITVRRTEPA